MTSPTKLPLFPASAGAGTAAPAAFDVRLVEARDLALIVQVHLRQFPDGFYARLGPAFMARYFQQYFRSPAAIGLVADQRDGSGLVGYLVGTVDDAAHDRLMNGRAAPVLAAAGASALARRPSLWSDFARRRALWYARRLVSRAVRPRRPSAAPRHGELLYICTTAGHRRRGVGAALLRAYVEGAQQARAASLHLVTERENASGRDFYEHRGWRAVSESVTRDGRPLVRLELSLGGATG